MGATETQVEAARRAVGPVVAALGCSLYDVELSGAGRQRTLRVTISRDGGLDLDTIAEATRAVSPALDASDAFTGPYLLEVSSPGVERSLRRPEHFLRAVGEHVSVKFHTDAGPRRVRGVVTDADDTGVVVDSGDGERVTVAYGDITQARTVFEWGPAPRPGGRARAKERS